MALGRIPRLAALLALSLALGCGAHLPDPFPLQWTAVDDLPRPSESVRAGLAGKTFRMEPTVDRRADPSKIGVDQDTRYEFRTTSDVSAFCSEHLHEMLNAAGFRWLEQGDLVVQSELGAFEVREGGTFDGDVRLTFRVFAPGKAAFEGMYAGKSKRWGRSHSPTNINEALSNGLAHAAQQLVEDESFARWLAAQPSTLPTGSP